MDRVLLVIVLIMFVFAILIPAFIWINHHFNDNEELDAFDEVSLAKLEIKKQLFHELDSWIKINNLNAQQIQEKLMLTAKRSADMVYQRIDKFTVDTLIKLVLRTGKSAVLTIKNRD